MNDELLKIDNQLCFRLYSASRKMTRLYQPYLKKYNLTYPQYIVMLVMFEHKKIDFNDLSIIVELKTGTLTPIIDKLVKLGYIYKKKSIVDARKVIVTLSEEGKQLNKDIIDVPLEMSKEIEITEEMYLTLVKEIDRLTEVLNESVKKQKNI